MKDVVEFRFPDSNLGLVVLGLEKSGNRVAPTPFVDIPLDLRDGSTI